MSTKRVEILEIEERKSKSGNVYRVLQCVVYSHEGKKRVGEMMVFNKELLFTEGTFVVDFEVDVNFDRQVVAVPVKFTPYIDPATVEVSTASSRKDSNKPA